MHNLQKMKFEPSSGPFRPRTKRFSIAALAIACTILTFFYLETQDTQWKTTKLLHSQTETLEYPDSARQMWSELLPLLEETAPNVTNPEVDLKLDSQYWEANVPFDLMDNLNMKHGDILKMSKAHKRFVEESKMRLPHYIPTTGGSKQGIVTVAGGTYFPVFLVSLRMLRRSGSTLPVEVFLANQDEYEPEICEEVLPTLGAKCMVLTDTLGFSNVTRTQEIKRFQYKIFAILFSTFEEVLFLDSDSFPLHDPRIIFDSKVFKQNGMITWPDLWATTISPAYYLIADQEPPPIILRASTESGQLFINKRTHFQTLLISAYYNYFGPSHYYTLLCQGGFGRGDKSTFIPAAIIANQSFYDVSERPRPVGQKYGWLIIYALIQFDPILDQNLTSHDIWRAKDQTVADPIRPFFLHSNAPKWNPLKLMIPGGDHPATAKIDGRPSYAFVDPPPAVKLIAGVERDLWEEVKWVGCQLEKKFKDWKEEHDLCSKVKAHIENVLDNPVINGTLLDSAVPKEEPKKEEPKKEEPKKEEQKQKDQPKKEEAATYEEPIPLPGQEPSSHPAEDMPGLIVREDFSHSGAKG